MSAPDLSLLYMQYQPWVMGYLCGKLNDRTAAEDLCSQVFLKITEKIDSFDDRKASVSTWIYTVTRNTLTDYFRTRRVYDEVPETLSDSTDVEGELCREEELETLASALKKLDERKRDIIILHYYKGITLKEIAERMELSYSYVKALHSEALEKLKKFF